MNIIDRIVQAAAKLQSATGVPAKYLYLGESEMFELHDYITQNASIPIAVTTGAKVYGLHLFAVISPSHMAVS